MRIVLTGTAGVGVTQVVAVRFRNYLASILNCQLDDIYILDLDKQLRRLPGGQFFTFLHDLPQFSSIGMWNSSAMREYHIWQKAEKARRHRVTILCTHASWQVSGYFYSPTTWIDGTTPRVVGRHQSSIGRILSNFKPNIFVNVIDNIYSTQGRLSSEHLFTLKEMLVWRNVELMQTDQLAAQYASSSIADNFRLTDNHAAQYPNPLSLSLSARQSLRTLHRLVFEPQVHRVYLSYPISEPRRILDDKGDESLMREINSFRDFMEEEFAVFDPVCIDERPLKFKGDHPAPADGGPVKFAENDFWPFDTAQIEKMLSNEVLSGDISLSWIEIQEVIREKNHSEIASAKIGGPIDAQIRRRDYRLIDQSDGVLIYRPTYQQKKWSRGGTNSEYAYAVKQGKPVVIIVDRLEDGDVNAPPIVVQVPKSIMVEGKGLTESGAEREKVFKLAVKRLNDEIAAHLRSREEA